MSSSLRNVVHRRNHKERGQLAGRERLGLLEKKRDYLLRARDYHSKQRRLKALREKALFRNPDEFYFKMINSKTEKGVHIQERNNQLPDEMVQLMKSQDRNYIRMHRDISKKKMEKIRDSLHFLDEAIDGDKADDDLAIYDGEEEQEDEESKPAPKKNTHIVFVDSEQEAKEFDPVKHLDTAPELVNRKFNRPRLETLKKTPIQAFASPADLKALRKEREAKYKEYAARLKREEDLRKVERELVIQKELRKGAKKKVGVDEYGLPIYKWRGDRKK